MIFIILQVVGGATKHFAQTRSTGGGLFNFSDMKNIKLGIYAGTNDESKKLEISQDLRNDLEGLFFQLKDELLHDELLYTETIGEELTYLKGYIMAITDVAMLFNDCQIKKPNENQRISHL